MSQTTYGSISQRTAAWASKEYLDHATPIEVMARYTQSKPVPKNTADNAKWRRPIPFAPATTPLVEGVSPAGHALNYEDVAVTLQQYGDFVNITDKVMDMSEDPVLKDAMSLNGEQAAETMENILWGVAKGGTAVAREGGGAASGVDAPITLTMIRNAMRALKAQRARFMAEMLAGSPNYKTEPVGAAFFGFGHTDLETDFRNLGADVFIPVEKYGQSMKAVPYEVGKVESLRIVLSPLFAPNLAAGAAVGATGMKSIGGVNIDVYPLVILSKGALGSTALRGSSAVQPLVLNPGVPRGGDPLGLNGTVGWKSWFAAMILNQAWMYRLEGAVTA